MLISLLTLKKLSRFIKLLKLELVIESGLLRTGTFLAKVTQIFVIYYLLKPNSWTNKIKDLSGEKVMESLYEKELLLSKL